MKKWRNKILNNIKLKWCNNKSFNMVKNCGSYDANSM